MGQMARRDGGLPLFQVLGPNDEGMFVVVSSAGNATASDTDKAGGFYSFGLIVLGATIFFLVCGLAATWYAAGFLAAVGGASLYFLALSPVVLYLLRSFRCCTARRQGLERAAARPAGI